MGGRWSICKIRAFSSTRHGSCKCSNGRPSHLTHPQPRDVAGRPAETPTAGKHMTCVFFCPKNLGQWDGGTQEKDVPLGCQSILVLHSLCRQMVGRWDSGTAGKHMTSVFFCPKPLGQWGGGTQEKHEQLGCQSIFVLHCLCPHIVGRWDSGTVGHKKNMYS